MLSESETKLTINTVKLYSLPVVMLLSTHGQATTRV
jgi:hypothetical protein